MIGLVHFLALSLLPMSVGYAGRRYWAAPTTARMLAATAVGGAAGLIGLSQLHMCNEGQPLAQWLLPGASASAAMLFVGARALRRTLVLASLLAAIALSVSFTTAVHGDKYTGNARASREGSPPPRAEWHTFLTGLYAR